MEDSKVLRTLLESVEQIYDSEIEEVPDQIGTDPMLCLKNIMQSVKTIVNSIQKSEHIEEITSVLHNVSEELKELASTVGSIEECHGTEGMGPSLVDKDGSELQVYNNPEGDSYAARNGFVG